ncbi:MAG: adenylate/guanylate cyclase domain-containing protein [Candidatus Rokuibacteriota bacterium]
MTPQAVRNRLLRIVLLGNLLGGILAFVYFSFLETSTMTGMITATKPLHRGQILYFVAGFSIIAAIVYARGRQWTGPLARTGPPPPGPEGDEIRRRALLLPRAFALQSFTGWVLAAFVWPILWPLLIGEFSVGNALRQIFGITFVAGTTTTVFVFLAVERIWRRRLPDFFPEGDLSAVPDTSGLRVRTRLLIVFLMLGLLPVAVLGIVALNRANALLTADPVAAASIVQNLIMAVVFLVAVGVATAMGLAVFVSNSVAVPLGDVQRAMARVERGSLDARCPVVSNDEIGAVAEGFNRMVHGLRERETIRETFGKYVSPEVRDEILAGGAALEGAVREVTILFADLRDFTPWVEATPPAEVVRDLNAYFTEMDAAIRAQKGLVLQFIGDEIEAVFGAPLPDPRHAESAVHAAVEMRRRLAAWNTGRRAAGKTELRHGIGIHTGTVLAGNIGSAERLSYALVGDPVNLASRIQALNKDFGTDILVSGDTRSLLDGGVFDFTPLPAAQVKGKSVEVEVYALA